MNEQVLRMKLGDIFDFTSLRLNDIHNGGNLLINNIVHVLHKTLTSIELVMLPSMLVAEISSVY